MTGHGGSNMETALVTESVSTVDVANQPLQATPGLALLFFLARRAGAPELRYWGRYEL
jgi:hypothetical protein